MPKISSYFLNDINLLLSVLAATVPNTTTIVSATVLQS